MSMTENEIIKMLEVEKAYMDSHGGRSQSEALAYAIESVKEIQQYRAIGTVEELKSMKENGAFTGVELAQLAAMQMRLKEYSAIGTIEEFNALKEKNTPYKPQEYEDKYYGCKCGEVLLEKWEVYPTKMMHKSWGLPYCLGCGQKLDWQ